MAYKTLRQALLRWIKDCLKVFKAMYPVRLEGDMSEMSDLVRWRQTGEWSSLLREDSRCDIVEDQD